MLDVRNYLTEERKKEYKIVPFWVWNSKLEPEVLKRQIKWMYENDIGGFFMHARGGLKTEYLSDEWMDCIELCDEEAEKLGMQAWIYDENGWPSGFAGGRLLENEEDRDGFIRYTQGKFDSEANVHYRTDGNKLERTETDDGSETYLNIFICVSPSTADILNPSVVKRFIEYTHAAYKKRHGKNFSKRISGFFTDEPQYYRWDTSYTRMLVPYFREKYNEDIFDKLGLLFVEKEGWREFRYRYWKAMQRLMLDNFAKQIYDWCDENNVKFTGHYVEEGTIGGQIMCCGGVMPFYAYEHIPGIDWLGIASGNALSIRQVASVAEQFGKKQVISEMFACCGWNISPYELSRLAGFQFVNGVNLMCQHMIPYAEYGERKRDYPAHYSAVNPWVRDYYKQFNDRFTNLATLIANAREKVNVALLHPIRSAYFDYKRNGKRFGVLERDINLSNDCRLFSQRSISYHFLDETLLSDHGFVNGDKIGCGKCEYEYLVLPHILTMDKSTECLLRKFANNGGKVLILGDKPKYIEAEEFDYSYLTSNVTLEQIAENEDFSVKNPDTDIYVTYRNLESENLMFVQNASAEKSYTQTFTFKKPYHSFIKVDPLTFEAKQIPLTIRLEPGENALLFPTEDLLAENIVEPKEYSLRFKNAPVSFDENKMTIDYVRYQKEGGEISEKIPCILLFQQLLEERYNGELLLQYEFDIREIPSFMNLEAEKNDGEWFVNGNKIEFSGCSGYESHLLTADISKYLKTGTNTVQSRMLFHQSDEVYYALFGEGVTESLRNCIVYDTELESIYLSGKFGVYSVDEFRDTEDGKFTQANDFYIGEVPQTVTNPEKEGFPFFSGKMSLSGEIECSEASAVLAVKGQYHAAEIFVNEKYAGTLLCERKLDISEFIHTGINKITAEFTIGNRNLLGPHHFKGSESINLSPWTFELFGTWKDGKSPYYRDAYQFVRFYCEADK